MGGLRATGWLWAAGCLGCSHGAGATRLLVCRDGACAMSPKKSPSGEGLAEWEVNNPSRWHQMKLLFEIDWLLPAPIRTTV